jgi:hypothetical protein
MHIIEKEVDLFEAKLNSCASLVGMMCKQILEKYFGVHRSIKLNVIIVFILKTLELHYDYQSNET